MTQFKLLNKRAEHNSIYNLKDRAFGRRLEKDYNHEVVYKYTDMETPIESIIQTSRLADRVDYKKISLPLTTSLVPGDIVYWERDNTNWLIYLQRNTEKNYFLGEMKEANYVIHWKDKYGVERSQLGCFTRNTFGKTGFNTNDIKVAHYLDYLDEDAQLLLTKTETAKSLKMYNKFIIEDTVWQVRAVDMTTYKNIIIYSLKLTELNKDEDTKDLPYGKVDIISSLQSNLEVIKNIQVGDSVNIKIRTELNGANVIDEYEVITENCLYENGILSFPFVGKSSVTIKSKRSNASATYDILVEEEPIIESLYTINGPSAIKATLSYTYCIDTNIDDSALNGIWSIKSKYAKITESTNKSCIIQAGKYTEEFDLIYTVSDEEIYIKHIDVKSLFSKL